MSTLEAKARNAFAVNTLNRLRHKLLGRDSNFSDKDAAVILDSLEMKNKNEADSKYVQYSLYGLANHDRAAAVELHDVINNTLSTLPEEFDENKIIDDLKNYLTNKNYSEGLLISKTDNNHLIKFINYLIDNFYSLNMLQTDLEFTQFKGL